MPEVRLARGAGPDECEPSRCAWAKPLQACVIAFVGRALRPCDAVKVSDARVRWDRSDSDAAQDIAPEAQRGREHVVHQYRRSASRLISSHAGCDEACKHSICCAWRKPRDGGNVRTGGETLHSATDEVRLSNRVVHWCQVNGWWSGGFGMVVRRPSNQMQQYGGSGELGPRARAWRASGWRALLCSDGVPDSAVTGAGGCALGLLLYVCCLDHAIARTSRECHTSALRPTHDRDGDAALRLACPRECPDGRRAA